MQDVFIPCKIRIYIKKSGCIYENNMLLAYNVETLKIEAIGKDAERFLEYPKEKVMVLAPLRQGKITDYCCFQKALLFMLQEALRQKKIMWKPKTVICLPDDIYFSEVDLKAFQDAAYQSGTGEVTIVTTLFEEAVEHLLQDKAIVIGVIMDQKSDFLKEQLKYVKEYAEHNHLGKEEVFRLLEQVYTK